MKQLTHLSLFSGIGGLDLAAEGAGFTSVGQCEFADYPYKVLCKHWADVPKWRDIRDLTGGSFYERTGLRTVDIISGGFPCQPFSVAGKRRGKEDDRYLWPEMLRVIKELHPNWVIGENVAGFINMGLDDALSDLEGEGYETRAFVIPACAVGTWHRRDRVFIVSNSKSSNKGRLPVRETEEHPRLGISGFDVSNSDDRCRTLWRERKLSAVNEVERKGCHSRGGTEEYVFGEWWKAEPSVGRVAYGIPSRVDRLKCLGNAVVPQHAYPIFKGVYDIENYNSRVR